MDEVRLNVLKAIIENNFTFEWGKIYYAPQIQEKTLTKLFKYYDQFLNTNDIIAYCDATFTHNNKNGVIFTLKGFYHQNVIEKPYYINYKDITDIQIEANKKGELHAVDAVAVIYYKHQGKISAYNITNNYDKVNFKKTIELLKKQVNEWDDVITFKLSGEIGNVELTDSQKKKCNAIIHSASVAAGGVGTGLAQIPLSDNLLITPIQITMITSLGLVFDIHLTEGAAKGILAGASASFIGRGIVQILWGWIPGIGNAINTATAAGITEAIGWLAVAHFFSLQQDDIAKHKLEGAKLGYAQASEEYEAKLRKLAREFLNQKRTYAKEKEEYENLISDYEEYIKNIELKLEKLKEEQSSDVVKYEDFVSSVKTDFENLVKLSL